MHACEVRQIAKSVQSAMSPPLLEPTSILGTPLRGHRHHNLLSWFLPQTEAVDGAMSHQWQLDCVTRLQTYVSTNLKFVERKVVLYFANTQMISTSYRLTKLNFNNYSKFTITYYIQWNLRTVDTLG